ncbi:hypothetical protein FXO38_26175 [Capsicum annuum]|nr:hypothetical protein FXO38_26175 [Capsicum annuum]
MEEKMKKGEVEECDSDDAFDGSQMRFFGSRLEPRTLTYAENNVWSTVVKSDEASVDNVTCCAYCLYPKVIWEIMFEEHCLGIFLEIPILSFHHTILLRRSRKVLEEKDVLVDLNNVDEELELVLKEFNLTKLSPFFRIAALVSHAFGRLLTSFYTFSLLLLYSSAAILHKKIQEISLNQGFDGYLNDPEATARTIDKEGWLHSGDIGYIDEDDELFIMDRLKELIKYKGFQVAPAELEALLLNLPDISDVAVIPMKDEEAGEVPVAFVVRSNGSTITEHEIKDFIYKQIEVDLLAEFPKWINSGMRRKSEEVAKKWIPIRYDYVPKYCKECRLQGHNEKEYYVITYNYVLPKIISKNQSNFVKGRSITENVLLAQKIIRDITRRNKLHNIVVKLDMAKVKCNIYEASRGKPGMSSYDFCIRDDQGNVIYARAKGLGVTTNTLAESLAIKEALKYCYENNFKEFILETDSLSLKQIILQLWRIPWELTEVIEDIRKNIQ